MFRSFVGKVQKGLSLFVHRGPALSYVEATSVVPDDVMEGYFAVVAIKGGETKRFIIELDYLTDPEFIGLLDKSQEEYGFVQTGTLAVPCLPRELQKILDDRRA